MPNASKSATSTINTFLMHFTTVAGSKPVKTDLTSVEKVVDIKSYPDFGGAPEKVETTTLSEDTSSFVSGVQKLDSFEFTANYILSDYTKAKTLEAKGGDEWWAVFFGAGSDGQPDGHDGIVAWKGGLTAYISGAGVNAAREMKLNYSVKTKPELVSQA
nr:hypothetical protein [uncultured Olsenella sp.]